MKIDAEIAVAAERGRILTADADRWAERSAQPRGGAVCQPRDRKQPQDHPTTREGLKGHPERMHYSPPT